MKYEIDVDDRFVLRIQAISRRRSVRWLGGAVALTVSAIAYADYAGFTGGTPISATAVNGLLNDLDGRVNGLDGRVDSLEAEREKPYVLASHAGPQFVPNGQVINLLFNSGTTWGNAITSDTSTFVFPESGTYLVSARFVTSANFTTSNTTLRFHALHNGETNPSLPRMVEFNAPPVIGHVPMQLTTVMDVAQNDTLRFTHSTVNGPVQGSVGVYDLAVSIIKIGS